MITLQKRNLVLGCVLALLGTTGLLSAQSIFTVAGGGTDDGKLATELNIDPRALLFDSTGTLYFSEVSGRVRKIDPATRKVTTIAGNGAGGFSGDGGIGPNATLKEPHGIARDAAGNLYIADYGNNLIRRVDTNGIITTFAGGGMQPSGEIGENVVATKAVLSGPWGMVIDRGYLYFTELNFDGSRIRRIKLDTQIIETYAGPKDMRGPGFAGDDGPASSARFDGPLGITADAAGNLFISDSVNQRIRRIELATGTITTWLMLDARPFGLAHDRNGHLIVSLDDGSIRRVDKTTREVTTLRRNLYLPLSVAVNSENNIFYFNLSPALIFRLDPQGNETIYAGGGNYVGDGLLAVSAILHRPNGVALDKAGNLYIADSSNNLLRRVSKDGLISTVAGKVGSFYVDDQEGKDAKDAVVGGILDVAIDSVGNLYTADPHNNRVWKIDLAGKITSYAGNPDPNKGLAEGKLATEATVRPTAIAFDAQDNLYITVPTEFRVRKVDAKTKIITTVAGNGMEGSLGDGGPATAAQLRSPDGVAVDGAGNLYIADSLNGTIRKVDRSGTISPFAGGGQPPGDSNGDGLAATSARMAPAHLAIDRVRNTLFLIDRGTQRLRKIDLTTNIISTVAGSANYVNETDFAGDNGAATAARLNFGYELGGVAVDPAGNVFFSDTSNNRIRAVFACVDLTAPELISPANSATNVATAPTLSWSKVPGAFRYDVFLGRNAADTRIASDVSETSISPANLQPSTQYVWKVVAKGDPFCTPQRTASSVTRTFTTGGVCAASPFNLISPADGADVPSSPVDLVWEASAGADSYDVYLGSTNPPTLIASGVKSTRYSAGTLTGRLFWRVVAHASCDATETYSSPIRSFSVLPGTATCVPPPLVITPTFPAPGQTGVATDVTLTWTASGAASEFEVYFGTTSTPPLLTTVASLTQRVESLAPGTTYFWRVAGKSSCPSGPGGTSIVSTFTTRTACVTPGSTRILFVPTTVAAGATYTVVWSPAEGLESDGGYLIERSLSPSFTTIFDSQIASSTAASFVAESPGTYFHRVQAISGCDPARRGPLSEALPVSVVAARANVIFTVQPQAVVTSLGERLEDKSGSFTLENVGSDALQVIVGRQEIDSVPFFSIADPQGRDAAFVTLEPRRPRTFNIRYSGPPNNTSGSYQGVVFVAATGQGLAVTPYAFVNLKIGGTAAPAPQFVIAGTVTDYAAFPGHAGDDAGRRPLEIGIRNSGSTPMELAAEIGPEVWLVPEPSWNAQPVAPGTIRNVKLYTQRARAPNGSALPRYTYFTVRTRDGSSSRLLVQDNDLLESGSGRTSRLPLSSRSFIVPEILSRTISEGRQLVSRLRLSNVGSDAVTVELLFTPSQSDGFNQQEVARAVVVVPANDVVTLTDPLVQVFGRSRSQQGQVEVRVPRERLGLISVSSAHVTIPAAGGFVIPTLNRGEGARVNAPHVLLGFSSSATVPAALVLVETSGADRATGRATLFNQSGDRMGETNFTLQRYGYSRIEDALASLGSPSAVSGDRIEITVDSGGGSVTALAFVGVASGAVSVSRAVNEAVTASALTQAFWKGISATGPVTITTVVPILPASTTAGAKPSYQTTLTLSAPRGSEARFVVRFRDALTGVGAAPQTITVAGGVTRTFTNVISELFSLPPTVAGSVFVDAPSNGKVYAVLQSIAGSSPLPAPSGVLALPTTLSESLTSALGSAKRPLFVEGLEQSIDPGRGSRWRLLLNELAGATGSVNVRLYEAGNRTRPIAERDIRITAFQQLDLDTVFASLGLDAADRRKDRTNVQCVVTAVSGSARVAASAVSVDNVTGDTKVFALVPSVGSATPGVNLVTPLSPKSVNSRRRAVGR
ncbi:MAG TPA: SMP-30/gluconolactonase/LRE family protein [Thermoanaerobaculia bacterium]|nr:SMP-30/gluconolactonase/LRE family protein [Thermoanaerobaculia bacterium]